MNIESKLQSEIVKYLRSKGCYVVKTKPGPGLPTGCPDIIFLLEGMWGVIEVKASSKSSFQPLQEHTLNRLGQWSYAEVIYPEIWPEMRSELEAML